MHKWDEEQELVISALATDRLVVDAGPGTGKTAVACARVAYLIDNEGIEPSAIWVISFTRTAVAELRQRIATYMEHKEDAHAVRIATLDSHTWTLHSGFHREAKLDGGYDSNIEQFRDRLRQDPEVQEYIGSIRHLIIDEAQDIVGIRSELIEEILKYLHRECGVTIFADRAQSIYGFSSDESENTVAETRGSETLIERLRKPGADNTFNHLALSRIFRTNSEKLLQIFSGVRQKVLGDTSDSITKLREVAEAIKQLADGEPDKEFSEELHGRDDLLILYRRRGEALLASSLLRERGIPHRLRMSGLPICVHPWIALCLSEHVEPTLSRQQFLKLWNRMPPEKSGDEEAAWTSLIRHAGKTADLLDMSRLTSVLGRNHPPAEFCLPDLGSAGPIVGTIHASKGREAATVHLMIPPFSRSSKDGNHDEETRVIFVGATRAKTELLVGAGDGRPYKKVEASGRVFRSLPGNGSYPRAQVEIGRDGDISATEVAGRKYFREASDVQQAQERLAGLEFPVKACAVTQREKDFVYALSPETGNVTPLAFLNGHVNHDLFKIGGYVSGSSTRKTRPPDKIYNLSIIGICSLILSPDSPERKNLHYPWSESGIALAPVVVGFTALSFPFQQYRKW